jgi:lysyl-tRNA synthetase class 2
VAVERTSFSSEHLDEAEYDADVEDLTITFADGAQYLYRNVPPGVWRGLRDAASAGGYFHRFIKGRFAYERV